MDKTDKKLYYVPTFLYYSISHFRCETASWMNSCDDLDMTEHLGSTKINTDSEVNDEVCNSKNYLMTDWNWQGREPFQPNIACAYYLPPLEGCRWVLELVEKRFDPIVGNNNCDCHCEDNVLFEEVNGQSGSAKTGTYCDFTDPPEDDMVGWCADNIGPDNIYRLLPFTTGKNLQHCNSNHVTQFSINISGVHTKSSIFRSCKTRYILWGRPVLQCL